MAAFDSLPVQWSFSGHPRNGTRAPGGQGQSTGSVGQKRNQGQQWKEAGGAAL